MTLKKLKSRMGFTLVEVIITVVVLGLFTAILIPGMSGYSDKAKEKAVRSGCLEVFSAAQAALDEFCAFHSDELSDIVGEMNVCLYEKDGKTFYDIYATGSDASNLGEVGRIRGAEFARVQNASPSEELDAADYLADRILCILESDRSAESKRYVFPQKSVTKSFGNYDDRSDPKYNTITAYLESCKSEITMNVYFDKNGTVFLVEYGKDGYLAALSREGVEVEKNGRPCWSDRSP